MFLKKGQIVVEYALLMMISVIIATLLVNLAVNRSTEPGEQGFIIQQWEKILQAIGEDTQR